MSLSPRTADVIDLEAPPFVVVMSADANLSDAGPRWTGLVTFVEALARPRAGYGGTIWLTQGRVLGPPPSADSERLMGLLCWRSRSGAEAFAAELSRTRSSSEFVDDVVMDDGIYQFGVSVTAISDDAIHVDPSRARSVPAHEVITLTPVSGKQRWIAEYNESETRDHIRNLDGFVSTTFFRDLRSDRIIEYVQWRSADDLTAAFEDERFAEHMSVNSRYSDGEAFLFAERSAGAAPIDGPFGCTSADPDGQVVAPQGKA